MQARHEPVMVDAVMEALGCRPAPGQVYLDCTVGLGGHAAAILERTAPHGRVIGCDRDGEALALAAARLAVHGDRAVLRQGAFDRLPEIVQSLGLTGVSGVLFDLGVSSLQLDTPERGFSFQQPGPLDMRMDRTRQGTAADWINRQEMDDLARTLKEYGDERWAGRIARAVVRHRDAAGPILRCETLEALIWRATPAFARHGRIHPATRTFQAIRMAVNQEIEMLTAGLAAAVGLLVEGGRLVVLSFHSVEDRCVKQAFKQWASTSQGARCFVLPHKKPLRPEPDEIRRNPRSRSAKLRVLERAA